MGLGGQQILLVDVPGAAQSLVRMVERAMPYDATGDYFRAQLMNFPLGDDFNSRINLNLREEKGYTYGAFSAFNGGKTLGWFEAGADLILMPADATAALEALEAGFTSGRWPIERLEESLRRREQALQASQSSPSQVTNSLKQLAELQSAHHGLQQELLKASLEHQGGQLPANGGMNLIRVDNCLQCPALPLNAPALIRWTVQQVYSLLLLLYGCATAPLQRLLLLFSWRCWVCRCPNAAR